MRRTPALIVGAGPAGAAAAIVLARAGAPHLVVERAAAVGDALCGGFLSWRSLATLAALGIEADALNRARVGRVRLFAGSRRREAALPGAGLAVSRHRLDGLLQARALREGAAIERGVAVREVSEGEARLADGTLIRADAVFLASGKRDVRGRARPAAARGADPTLGLRTRLSPSPAQRRALAGVVELHLFRGGYAGLALQEDGTANLCLAVHRSLIDAAGSPATLLRRLGDEHPALADRLAGWSGDAPIDAVANVPYGWRATTGEPGLYRLGDQAAVIPSLAGEGMGIALASGLSAARRYLADGGAGAATWQRDFAAAVSRPLAVAGAIRALVEGAAAPAAIALLPPGAISVAARLTRVRA